MIGGNDFSSYFLFELLEGLGGPGRVRTDDLFHAMEARSQLRHRPTGEETMIRRRNPDRLNQFSPTG
jgi:hypothetical protein